MSSRMKRTCKSEGGGRPRCPRSRRLTRPAQGKATSDGPSGGRSYRRLPESRSGCLDQPARTPQPARSTNRQGGRRLRSKEAESHRGSDGSRDRVRDSLGGRTQSPRSRPRSLSIRRSSARGPAAGSGRRSKVPTQRTFLSSRVMHPLGLGRVDQSAARETLVVEEESTRARHPRIDATADIAVAICVGVV